MFFDDRKLTKRGAPSKGALKVIERAPVEFELMSIDELNSCVGDEMIFDVECYVNYFLVSFKHDKTDKIVYFEQTLTSYFNVDFLHWMMWSFCHVGFNSWKYDMPMVWAAISGKTCEELKAISNSIIQYDMRPNDVCEKYGFRIPHNLNHYDISEVAPLPAKKGEGKSLKVYAARMHAKRLQDLPYHESTVLTDQQIDVIRDYNINTDLVNTKGLRHKLADALALRVAMSKQYGQDLRSKSSAQIAEVVIVSEVTKLTGKRPQRAKWDEGDTFFYKAPHYIHYISPELNNALAVVQASPFVIDEFGSPKCPSLQELRVNIGGVPYAMGLGGLHSMESCRTLRADDEHGLSDIDVRSYYPRLILNEKLTPKGMGPAFLVVYEEIVDGRLAAKDRVEAAKAKKEKPNAEDVTKADGGKVTANGTFGKAGSRYSMMYAPDGMIQVTLTGQFSILMLIEWLVWAGFEAKSGNTDGILVRYKKKDRDYLMQIVKYWESATRLETEETKYAAMYQRDVNNYIAVKEDGEVKLKGKYAEKGSTENTVLSKNPEALICSDALVAYLTKQTPFEKTIQDCRDIRRFVVVRNVKGGAQKNGYLLGKVIRYYYAKNSPGVLSYVLTGNAVPDSEGAYSCMDLPDKLPTNIDLDRYIAICNQALIDIGAVELQTTLFS